VKEQLGGHLAASQGQPNTGTFHPSCLVRAAGGLPVPPNWVMVTAVTIGQTDVGVVQLGTAQLCFSLEPGDSRELPGLGKVLGKY